MNSPVWRQLRERSRSLSSRQSFCHPWGLAPNLRKIRSSESPQCSVASHLGTSVRLVLAVGNNASAGTRNKGQAMEIEGTTFGTITIDGKTYEHDVIIRLSGEVLKRKKKLSKKY